VGESGGERKRRAAGFKGTEGALAPAATKAKWALLPHAAVRGEERGGHYACGRSLRSRGPGTAARRRTTTAQPHGCAHAHAQAQEHRTRGVRRGERELSLRYLKGASEGRQRVLVVVVVLRQGGEEKRRRAALEE